MAEIVRFASREALVEDAARRWANAAAQAVSERGRFSVALAGGSTPRPLYQMLASEPYASALPWEATFVFWGDERRVPPGHPDSNYGMAADVLLNHVPVPRDHVYRMDGEDLANSAARAYDRALAYHFDLGPRDMPRFDLILLGLGADGHTASIFPGTRAVSDRSNRVLVYTVPQLHSERMTLTLPVLNNARHVLFLASGEDKAAALAAVTQGTYRPSTLPAQAVDPQDGTLVWLVDAAAASLLDPTG